MKEYEVWIEGYAITGQQETAKFLGNYKANNFIEASKKALLKNNYSDIDKNYNEKFNTYWGCKLYDNEEKAREYFG
jgi:hypothetical protein